MIGNIPENTYTFIIRTTLDRHSDLFCACWLAIWNGHLYGNTFDINKNKYINFEGFLVELSKILTELKIDIVNTYQAIDKNIEKGNRTIEELYSSLSPYTREGGFVTKCSLTIIDTDIDRLLEKAKKEFS